MLLAQLAFNTGGGSSPSEVLTAAANITAGDFESWYRSFDYLGTKIYNISQHINAKKYPVSAREALFRSATYFRTAGFYLVGNISDPRLYSLWDQQTTAFNAAIALLPVPGYRITLPGPGFEIPVIFYPASKDSKKPTILAGTGYDGSQEEIIHEIGHEVLSRGYNFVTYEGPGQPTVSRDQQLGFIPQWEKVVTPVIDYLSSHPQVDANAIALVGISFGGSLAPIAAAHEHRLAAVIAIDGMWSFFKIMGEESPSLLEFYNASNASTFDAYMFQVMADPKTPTSTRWGFQQGLWAFKTTSPYDYMTQVQQYTLTNELLGNITAPVFVGMGMDDITSVDAPLLEQALGEKGTLFRFGSDVGAGEHCQIGAEDYLAQVTMDWFQDVLDARKGSNAGN